VCLAVEGEEPDGVGGGLVGPGAFVLGFLGSERKGPKLECEFSHHPTAGHGPSFHLFVASACILTEWLLGVGLTRVMRPIARLA
jgi:hypothetical protein